jgi:GT2 family glycosyltransferase
MSSLDPPTPQADAPFASVIVPVRNDAARLGECLECLANSAFRDFEVIVADDASGDGSGAAAQKFPGVKVVTLAAQGGAGAARNAAANIARGEILVFVDADVCVGTGTVGALASALARAPELSAVFGNYDDEPGNPALISQYRNLLIHYMHAEGADEASIFFSGCGAIRRRVFVATGGFREGHLLEDIELGRRLLRAGQRIRLEKSITVKHMKRFTLAGTVRTDIVVRGIPWTRLLLEGGDIPDDLHVGRAQRLAAAGAGAFALLALVAALTAPLLLFALAAFVAEAAVLDELTVTRAFPRRKAGVAFAATATLGVWSAASAGLCGWAALACLGVVLGVNRGFYGFLRRRRGRAFAAYAVVLHGIYYLCALSAFAIGYAAHALGRPASSARYGRR